jgi:hypothetical protein
MTLTLHEHPFAAYCWKALVALYEREVPFERQSQELDIKKRVAMVIDIQKRLEQDAPRPILAQRLDYFAHWPHVKGLVAHNNVYNFPRFTDVWRDK